MASDFNNEIYEQNTEIFAALGFALSNFANIEFGLLALFDRLTNLNQSVSAALFWSFGSTRNQLKALDALAEERLKDHVLREDWRSLRSEINRMVEDRDRLAHGEVVPLQRTPQVKDVFFAPRFQKNLARSIGTGPLDWQPAERLETDKLVQIARRFWLTARKIDALWDQLGDIEPRSR